MSDQPSKPCRDPKYLDEVYRRMKKEYGDPETPLSHCTPEQLAVAVVLSAQTTDDQVNQVTPELFRHYPDLPSMAKAPLSHLEKLVYSTGFYKNKARHIKGLAEAATKEYGGKIPRDFEQLLKLPGVGRKTANVIMDCAFHESVGIVVDTHVKRLSNRLGFTTEKDPIKIEKDLMSILPRETWRTVSLYLMFLGRAQCDAKKPVCSECYLSDICPSAFGC